MSLITYLRVRIKLNYLSLSFFSHSQCSIELNKEHFSLLFEKVLKVSNVMFTDSLAT